MEKSLSKRTIALFWQHARRYPTYLFSLLAIVPINILIADFAVPYITSQILQKISAKNFNPADIWGSFGLEISLYAAGVLLTGTLGWRVIIWLIWKMEMNVVRDIAQRVFEHLMHMSANFHANRFGGSLVSQANKLTSSYIRFADTMIFNTLTLITALIATIVILAPRVPLYALALVVLATLYIVGTFYFSKPVREANTQESEAQSKQTGFLADSITNVMAVKGFAAAKAEAAGHWKVASHTRDMTQRSMLMTSQREIYASLVNNVLSILSIIIAVISVSKFNADIATVYLVVTFTGNIMMRLWDFQNVLRQYNRAMGDASDMVKILAIEPSVKDPHEPQKSKIHAGSITFENVGFTHAGAHKKEALFTDLDLHIKPGEKVGLVGQSGSGKTTLTRLLLRFSDIDHGRILIDGQDIREITQDDLRRSISYVPQEPLLFHRSIAENIAYGNPTASRKAIAAIARSAHADEFIDKLPDGYKTLVGERGVKLSGGQRQRVVIARAMLKNAPILVLDEATSALDSESEVLIQDALWKLMDGRTAIVIAHRLSTIQKMDRIIVMDHGRIVEQGTHKELVRQNGAYAKLWAHQSGGFIEE